MIGLPFLPVYNDFQFKTETKFNQKNELTILGIGAYDVNHLNKGMKDPDDDQRYMLNYLPESVQWSYTIGITYKHYGDRWEPPFRTQSQYPTKRDREIHQQRQKPSETGGLQFRRNGE